MIFSENMVSIDMVGLLKDPINYALENQIEQEV